MWCIEDVCRRTQSKHPAHCETFETCKCFFLKYVPSSSLLHSTSLLTGVPIIWALVLLSVCVYEAIQVSLWYYITEIIQGWWSLKPAQLVWLCLPEGQTIRLNYLTTLCLNQQVSGTIERSNLRTLWMCHSAIWIQTAEWSGIWTPPEPNQYGCWSWKNNNNNDNLQE